MIQQPYTSKYRIESSIDHRLHPTNFDLTNQYVSKHNRTTQLETSRTYLEVRAENQKKKMKRKSSSRKIPVQILFYFLLYENPTWARKTCQQHTVPPVGVRNHYLLPPKKRTAISTRKQESIKPTKTFSVISN